MGIPHTCSRKDSVDYMMLMMTQLIHRTPLPPHQLPKNLELAEECVLVPETVQLRVELSQFAAMLLVTLRLLHT